MTPNRRSLLTLLSTAVIVCAASVLAAPPKPVNPAPAKPAATPAKAAAARAAGSEPVLYVPGAYQNWTPASAPQIVQVKDMPGVYEGYINIPTGSETYFKYTNAPDWNNTNYGHGPGNNFDTDVNAPGLSVPEPGYYEISADLNKNTWTATKTVWSLCGDATPNGWEHDTPMTFDAAKQVWTVTLDMKASGSYKFRANEAWKIDFAVDGEGKMQYADNPLFPYNSKLNNMTVPADGTYVITLDLHESGKYTYSAEAK